MKTPRQVKREARELWQVCLQDGLLDEARARLVVDQIAESQRAAAVPLLKQFLRRLRLDRAERTAVVASAAPLDPAVRAEIERGLARLPGRVLDTRFVVDPSLIGGMRVQIGSTVYDGSVRAGLAALESQF
ncbi:MAG TPA: F0F1 ATP synthase subunit delta [Vicinamibacterales bacterium]|nr:F0F1 ATP synthase subunit delta [Vicinamibacterales bacterium]